MGAVEVVVDGLGFRGEGYVEFEDGWLSIPGALPGERVAVEVEAPRRRRPIRVFGTLTEVVVPSKMRSAPHCDRVDVCRGCQLRHVSVVDELFFKAQSVSECVERYAGLAADEIPEVETISVQGATRADSFRVRTSLTARFSDGAWRTGIRAPHDRLVEMQTCPALADSCRRAVARVDAALTRQPAAAIDLIRVASPVHGHGYVDVCTSEDEGALKPLVDALDRDLPGQFGIAVTSPSGRRHVRGPRRFRLPMADLRLEVGMDDWFHATLEPAERLYDCVEEWLDVQPGERVVDAGCGIGTIGLACARKGARVVGFDVNRSSIETAELNAMANDLEVEFRSAGWERGFRKLVMEGREFDTIVINPMREPLGERALAYAGPLGARRILYLGPSPAPASKDLGVLVQNGWTLRRLAAANLHPHTYHVMLVAQLDAPSRAGADG